MSQIKNCILHEYPYPIAKCYERLVATTDVNERWNAVRYLFEVTLKYSASVAVARYIHNKEPDMKVDTALACLNRPTLGQWSNLLLRCVQHNQRCKKSFLPEDALVPVHDKPAMIEAHAALLSYSQGRLADPVQRLTITHFLESFVAYRNRSSGHGSPSRAHIEEITPLLETAAVELLAHLDVLKQIQLMYVSDIHLNRKTYVHSVVSLMGNSPVALADYETDAAEALIGHDRQLYLSEVGGNEPVVSLHPLGIYTGQEVFLLHRSDLRRNVEYICHHLGQFYSADRIFEDFRETFGGVLGESEDSLQRFQPEDVYEESVRMALMDATLTLAEEQYLLELRNQLELTTEAANQIEARVRKELEIQNGRIEMESVKDAVLATANSAGISSFAHTSPRVLFLSYASIRTGFWADLVSRLASGVHQIGYAFSLVTPPHSNDYDVAHTANLVAEIDKIINLHQPDLMLMVPFPSESFSSLFRSRAKNIKIPVVTLDTEIIDTGPFNDALFTAPPILQVDNYEGGKLMAELMWNHAWVGEDIDCRFLVMPGLDGAAHSQARVDGFSDKLAELSPQSAVRVLPAGQFNRARAKKLFQDFLVDVELERYDGIFCCNDEMALGVYAAIREHLGAKGPVRPFKIGGFNNTVEFAAVQRADTHGLLAGSVDQNLDEYILRVLDTVDVVLAGETPAQRTLIPPRLELA